MDPLDDQSPKNPGALNSICPVCGSRVSSDIPPIELKPRYTAHHEQELPAIAVALCSQQCIDLATADPDRYLEAARREIASKSIS